MPEKAIETRNLKVPKRVLNIPITIWVDAEILTDIDLIAAYEHTNKRSPLLRRIIQEKIRVYKRNPGFKQFLKQLRDMQEAKKSE